NPSRASRVAAVEPAGPPPITRTCVELFILPPLSSLVEGNASPLAHVMDFSRPGDSACRVVRSTFISQFLLYESMSQFISACQGMLPDRTSLAQGATHTCIVASSPPEAIYFPSGDQAITRTGAVCWKVNSLRLVIVSHTCTVLSSLAKAKRFPSGDHATAYT